MMNCQLFKHAVAGGEPPAAAQAHAASCPSCREWQTGQAAVQNLVAGLERVPAPGDFDFRLRARIARRADRPVSPPVWRRLPVAVSLAGLLVAASWLGSAYFAGGRDDAFAANVDTGSWQSLAQIPFTEVPATETVETQATDDNVEVERPKRVFISAGAKLFRVSAGAARPRIVSAQARQSDAFAVTSPTNISAASDGVIHLRFPASKVKVELENKRLGKRVVFIDTLTLGREGQVRNALATNQEPVVW